MPDVSLIDCGNGFWSLRAPLKIKGLINVGTQASLVEGADGRFVWLDCAPLSGDAERRVAELTDNGAKVAAVLNLHPFHTLYCMDFYRRFPNALFFGSARHKQKCPDIPWQADLVESDAVAQRFAGLLEFSLPRGVDYISANENVHFSSLMAYHAASRTVHSDDTLNFFADRFPINLLPGIAGVNFHMTLAKALQKRSGAAQDFRDWAREMADHWGDARRLCAAHKGMTEFPSGGFADEVMAALERVEPVLARHESEYGQ